MKETLGFTVRLLVLVVTFGGIQAVPDHDHDPTVALVMTGTAMLALLLILVTVVQIAVAASKRSRAGRAKSARAAKASVKIAGRQPSSIGPTGRMRQSIASEARR